MLVIEAMIYVVSRSFIGQFHGLRFSYTVGFVDLVSDIKARINIEDLVGGYVQLKKVGRSYKGLCPFHQEKTPSFYVNPEKQLAYCFGCHQGGDLFAFYQLIEGADFPQALSQLAERAGLNPQEYRTSFQKIPNKSQKQPFFEVHEKAADFFSENLWNTDDGKKVLDYLFRRGLTEKTIRDFRLGFSPDEFDALTKYLLEAHIDRTVLIQSGLVIVKDVSGDRVYDRFRGRLMFPIKNTQGMIVGFGARALKKEMEPKYLNSPETPLYHKSEILYGFCDAKNVIREKGVLLVEGYMDLIACHQAGFTNAVATSGTALTTAQVKLLRRSTDTFYFCFDRDFAGWEASKHGFLEVLSQEGFVRMVQIPSGKDPAECLQSSGDVSDNASSESFSRAISDARPFLDIYFDRLFEQYFGSDVGRNSESVIHVMKEAVGVFQQIRSPVVLDLAIRDLAKRLDIREDSIYQEISRSKSGSFSPKIGKTREAVKSSDSPMVLKRLSPEETFLAVLFHFPEKFALVREKIFISAFSEKFQPIFTLLLEKGPSALLEAAHLHHLDEESCRLIHFLSFYAESVYAQLRPHDLEKLLQISLDKIFENIKNTRLGVLKKSIRKAESEKSSEELKILMEELKVLLRKS